jgi:hypothetical protein
MQTRAPQPVLTLQNFMVSHPALVLSLFSLPFRHVRRAHLGRPAHHAPYRDFDENLYHYDHH